MMPEEVVEMGLQEHDVVVVTSFSLLQALDIGKNSEIWNL